MRKIPTLFVRDFTRGNGGYVTDEVTPGCAWVLAGEGVATRKWDGTCVLIRDDGTVAARREVKAGKIPPPGFDLVERDPVTGKTVGWEPAEQSSFAKYIAEAFDATITPGTYELVGPKINGNPQQLAGHLLMPHGAELLDLPDRDFYSLRSYLLAAAPFVEGIVFWRVQDDPDAGMAKIKGRDFDLGSGDVPA